MTDAQFNASLHCHSHGKLRVTIGHESHYVVAKIHSCTQSPYEATVNVFLHTPEEIAAWTALSEALAAADVKEDAA